MSDSLRAFIEVASDKIERIFRIRSVILPMWHYIDRHGIQQATRAPPGDKDRAATIMRALFQLHGATRCLYIDEAWTWDGFGKPLEENERVMNWIKEHGGLADFPDRVEVVVFAGEDQSESSMQAHRRIIRGQGKPKLGPLEFLDMVGVRSEGRMVGMLPRRAGEKVQ